MRNAFIILLLSLTLPYSGLAQKEKPADYGIRSKKALKYYYQGLDYMRIRDRGKAMAAFEAALAIEPDFAAAHFQMGANAFSMNACEVATPHLEKAWALDSAAYPNAAKYLGSCYFYSERYAEALPYLIGYLNFDPRIPSDRANTEELIKHAAFASEAIQDPAPFEPVNLGPNINTPYDEYIPALNADDSYLLFVARRPESTGGYNEKYRGFTEDFFYSEWVNKQWSESKNLGPPINTELNEGAATLSQDGRTIYFTACNRRDGYGDCDIYFSNWTGKGWSEPINLGRGVNTRHKETQPSLSHDGRTLYFSSSRPNGQGAGDIWFSRWMGDHWGKAQNMGAPINTPGHETGPYIHADGQTFYFNSNYHPGFGGADLFVSRLQPDGNWGTPQNLGYPINTSANETNLFVTTAGDEAYITSERQGGYGLADIWRFRLAEKLRPVPSTYVRGVVLDSTTSRPVVAEIHLIDLKTADTLRQETTDPAAGQFLVSLPGGHEYAALVEAPGYLFASQHFDLREVNQGEVFDLLVLLKPLRVGSSVVLNNIFFETGSYALDERSRTELEVLLRYLQNNPGLRIEIQGHTDNVGSVTDNRILSQNRAEAVRKYLVNRGITPNRVTAKGYGESKPVADNTTEEGRAQNRRTEFLVVGE